MCVIIDVCDKRRKVTGRAKKRKLYAKRFLVVKKEQTKQRFIMLKDL